MKYQIIVTTPLGTFVSEKIKPESDSFITQCAVEIATAKYFSFNDESGDAIVLPEDTLRSSVFRFKVIER